MTCCLPPGTTGACCIGEWDPLPYQPPFSCGVPGTPACLGCQNDEIAHAALIPVGNWHVGIPPDQTTADIRGMVVLWTRCDDRPGYKTHLWDPNDPGGIAFQSSILEKINPPNEGLEDGPFCSGHVWILDANKNPKLLTVGGQDRGDNNSATPEAFEDQDPGTPGIQNPCIGTGASFCGLHKVYWFDPLVLDPDNAWSDAPEDLTLGLWYPSVTTLLDASGTQFLPLVFGGSPRAYQYGCDSPVQTQSWWTSSGLGGAWATHGSSYYWHYYPRPFQLTDGTLLSAGHAILCEDNVPTNPFGGNPVSVITSAHVRSAGPSPNPDDTNLATATAGGWNYCNAAILHTLNDFSYTEVDPLSHYDLDRVLVTGGSQQLYDNGLPVPAQPYTHEYVGGQWVVKASPIQPRVYASWVTLPDRTLLLVGGSSHQYQENSERYYSSVERFAPQGPTAPGVWSPMAPRPSVPGYSDAPARGYHHVSLLLQDGRVAVMGGIKPSRFPWNQDAFLPWSSIEIYRPPYSFENSRLKILSTQVGDMQYDDPFLLNANFPDRVQYACLIGVGSVTHSFDYGQRYVELMATPVGGPFNLKLWAPPLATMAPEGYYMLFLVEDRGGRRVPSKGVFVKLVQ